MPATAVTRPARKGPIRRQRMPEYKSGPYCCPTAAPPADSAQANRIASRSVAPTRLRGVEKNRVNTLRQAIPYHLFVRIRWRTGSVLRTPAPPGVSGGGNDGTIRIVVQNRPQRH